MNTVVPSRTFAFALWMKSTDRNSRRIVTELERLGIISLAGEEQLASRSRPRKIYQF